MRKRNFFLASALMLCIALIPATVFAAGAPWAEDAVNELNAAYGADTFAATDGLVTAGAAKALLRDTFSYTGEDVSGIPKKHIFTTPDTGNLTRMELCAMIFSILQLPKGAENDPNAQFEDTRDMPNSVHKDAIGGLKRIGVVNGRPDGTFDPGGTVNDGEFAIMFYRALRATAGLTPAVPETVPGEYGAFEMLYLSERGALQFNELTSKPAMSWSEATDLTIVEGDTSATYTGGDAIWNFWTGKLSAADSYGDAPTGGALVDAIVRIVNADRDARSGNDAGDPNARNAAAGVFSDVNPTDWFYEGVMYLQSKGIVRGNGNGEFMPAEPINRAEIAAVAYRMSDSAEGDPAPTDTLDNISDLDAVSDDRGTWEWAYGYACWALDNGYLFLDEDGRFRPFDTLMRQEIALVATRIYTETVEGAYYDQDRVNLAVLDRFADKDSIDDAYRPAMAYIVSAGVINGTGDGYVNPTGLCSRAEMGVILARVMQGIDTSKMKDYKDDVEYILSRL
jgi:hypothetical protein